MLHTSLVVWVCCFLAFARIDARPRTRKDVMSNLPYSGDRNEEFIPDLKDTVENRLFPPGGVAEIPVPLTAEETGPVQPYGDDVNPGRLSAGENRPDQIGQIMDQVFPGKTLP